MSMKAATGVMVMVPVLGLVAIVGGGAASFTGLPVNGPQATPNGGTAQALATDRRVPDTFRNLINKWGNHCPALSPRILAAQLYQESGFRIDKDTVSSAGAQGIAQFMPQTWAANGVDGNGDGKKDIWDPEDAIPSAAVYDCKVAHDTRNAPGNATRNMLAGYNAGSYAVRKYGGIPPYRETQNYVRIITSTASTFNLSKTATAQGQGNKVIASAAGMIGKPYSWGGGDRNGPTAGTCCSPNGSTGKSTVGFDCSGLTIYAYAAVGITLPRTAAQQYAASKPVDQDQAQPGDLVFYGTSPETIHHVAIYLGNGNVLNAAKPGTKVRQEPLNSMPDLYAIARPTPTNQKV